MSWVHRCIIVHAAIRDQAAGLCAALAGPGGTGMFETPLSSTGQEPATHYISSGMIEEEFAAMLENPELVVEASEGAVTLEQAQALLSMSDVSEETPQQAFERLGLQIIQPEVAV